MKTLYNLCKDICQFIEYIEEMDKESLSISKSDNDETVLLNEDLEKIDKLKPNTTYQQSH